MIDTWFKKDLQKIYDKHQIAVFIDESREAAFLPEMVKQHYNFFTANTELEELKVKYEIEKNRHDGRNCLIYTNTPKERLKFIREYCETNGVIEIRYLQNYIKDKVHKHLGLNLHLEKEELISAARVSIGKDQTYWMDLAHKGASQIFNLEKELLPFLDNPKEFLKQYDPNVQEQFFKKVNELIKQPYVEKPAETLASEVVKHLLDGLADNNPDKTLLHVYQTWLDSKSFQASFGRYLAKYKLPPKSDIFAVHPAHPFLELDELWLKELGKHLDDKKQAAAILQKINRRLATKTARNFDIGFWVHVKILLEFDSNSISKLTSFDDCVIFYTTRFYKSDRAIRCLYARFLSKKELLAPLQEFYKNFVALFLDKWFRYIGDYKTSQPGKLQEILDTNATKTAIVVGDGIAYEFAREIAEKVSKEYLLADGADFMFADLPSETVHNMSRLYVRSGEIYPEKSKREAVLAQGNPYKQIEFTDLEKVNELTDKAHYLVCHYKEPDKLGETYQQQALKHFDEISSLYAAKIEQLLKNGYVNVYLVTDHGYVLTGILENSDKIEVDFTEKVEKAERYICSANPLKYDSDLLVEKPIQYNGYNYYYFARRLGPFKTPGVYGYSHGGWSPQETIIPFMKWSRSDRQLNALQVSITNKRDLEEVTGDIYAIKLKAESEADDLFSSERKVVILFFAGKEKINESDIITIKNQQELKKEYRFGSHTEIEIKILDAESKEQLDKTVVRKSASRDLGGLI
jgi:hypothetical protein